MRSDISKLPLAKTIVYLIAVAYLSITPVEARQSLDELEEQALQAAGDFAQEYTVQVEAFGGQEFVNRQGHSERPRLPNCV